MRAIQHKSNNRVFGAPNNWDQKNVPCGALPVTDVIVDGLVAIESYWIPTPLELIQIREGGSIRLTVVGGIMPPVAISVEAKS